MVQYEVLYQITVLYQMVQYGVLYLINFVPLFSGPHNRGEQNRVTYCNTIIMFLNLLGINNVITSIIVLELYMFPVALTGSG